MQEMPLSQGSVPSNPPRAKSLSKILDALLLGDFVLGDFVSFAHKNHIHTVLMVLKSVKFYGNVC